MLPLKTLFPSAQQSKVVSSSATCARCCKTMDMRKLWQMSWLLWTTRYVVVIQHLLLCVSQVAGHRQDYPSQPEYTSTMSKKFRFKRTRESTINGVEKMTKNGLFNLLQNQFIAQKIAQEGWGSFVKHYIFDFLLLGNTFLHPYPLNSEHIHPHHHLHPLNTEQFEIDPNLVSVYT